MAVGLGPGSVTTLSDAGPARTEKFILMESASLTHTYRQTDTYTQTDRQTDTHTKTHTESFFVCIPVHLLGYTLFSFLHLLHESNSTILKGKGIYQRLLPKVTYR